MIYLDNAATTYPKPTCVYDDADKFYREFGVYPGRGNHYMSIKVNNLINETRQKILNLFNAPINYKAVFTPSATFSANYILNGLNIKDNANIYISHFEHNSILRVLNILKKRANINLSFLDANCQTLMYNINEIKNQFIEFKPDIVILNHASNVFGNVAPAHEIFDLAKKYGATTILDCSQTSGLIDIDLKQIKSDFTIFAGHKTLYAPFGIAGFIMNNKNNLNPLIFGGTGSDSANANMPKTYPERLEAGSIDVYAVAGLYSSLNWINKIGIHNILEKELSLYEFALNQLSKMSNIKLHTPLGEHVGIISFNIKGYNADDVALILNNNNIAVRAGLHCSPAAHKFIGTFPSGTVRISFNYFNNENDIKTLLKVINKL